jgi:hypothetical protein
MPTILILGASSDIGYAISRSFAAGGYDVQLAGRDTASLEAYRSDIKIRYDVGCSLHPFDALRFGEHAVFFEQLPTVPDVVVYVAGFMADNEEAERNWEVAARTIHTNYTGAVSLLNIVAHHFAQRGRGTIAGISSVAGNRGRQSNYIYGSAKAGFTAYLSGLRNKLYHHNVHVMTVLPGFVATRMTEHLNLPGLLTAQPEEVGEAVYRGVQKKRNVLYVKWFWRWIMLIITSVPESIFKKRKL